MKRRLKNMNTFYDGDDGDLEGTKKKKRSKINDSPGEDAENQNTDITVAASMGCDQGNVSFNEHTDSDHRKKKTKKHHHKDDTMEDISLSEHTNLEGSVKKKKKKHKKDQENFEEVGSADNLLTSRTNNGDVIFGMQEELVEPAQDCGSNDGKGHKKHKKKKKKEVLSEEDLEKAEDVGFDETRLQSPRQSHRSSDRVLATEEYAGDEASAKKKKKKKQRAEDAEPLRHSSLEEEDELSMNGEENVCMSRKKEKTKKRENDLVTKKKRTMPEGNNSDTEDPPTENIYQTCEQTEENEVHKSSKKAKRQDRGPREAFALEDPMCSTNTDTEGSLQHKGKKKAQRTDRLIQTSISSFCEKIKQEESPQGSTAELLEKTAEDVQPEEDVGTEAETSISTTPRKPGEKRTKPMAGEEQQSDANEETTNESSQSAPKKNQKGNQSSLNSKSKATNPLGMVRKRDLLLLEEYIPNIKSLSANTVREIVNSELERIKVAKSKGILFKTGRFDSAEDELIKENVSKFLTVTGLDSGEMLFHSYKFPQKKEIESLKKKYHFRQRIAEGLYRTTRTVHERGQKLFDLSSHKSRFTKKDVKKLKKHIRTHGNSWTTIGTLTGRTNRNVQLKASQLRHKVNKGKWTTEEVNALIQAVKKFVLESLKGGEDDSESETEFVPKENLYSGIPWVKVEEEVQTRNWSHCKSKWNDILLLRMNNGISPFEGILRLQTNIKIITWLHKRIKEGIDQIDWEVLGNAVGNVPPGIMQQKVYKMKSRYVPGWQELSFKEIVDFMYTDVLPTLCDRLCNTKRKDSDLELPERKLDFSISDIFGEYTGPE